MAQGLFPLRRKPLTNYDWTDIASATGYIEYDAYINVDSVGINYNLVETSNAGELFSSNDNTVVLLENFMTKGESSSSTFAKTLSVDFDSYEFQLPRILKGRAYVHFGAFLNELSSVGANPEYYFIIRLRKSDNTEIASVQTHTYQTSDKEATYQVQMEVPKTLIKKGEKVRLTIEGWSRDVGDDAHGIAIGGDPQDRADTLATGYSLTAGNSRIVLTLPFRMEL